VSEPLIRRFEIRCGHSSWGRDGWLERETGQRPHGTIEDRPVDPLAIDFPKIVKELNACSIFVRFIERESCY
jgi:hypothetical protein